MDTTNKEELFADLHTQVAVLLTSRLKEGAACDTADIRAAIAFLKDNNITGVAATGSPTNDLLKGITDLDASFLESLGV